MSISFKIDLDAKAESLTSATKKLDELESEIKGTAEQTSNFEKQIKRARDQLNQLKAPSTLKALTDEIERVKNPIKKTVTETEKLQRRLKELRAPHELKKLKKDIADLERGPMSRLLGGIKGKAAGIGGSVFAGTFGGLFAFSALKTAFNGIASAVKGFSASLLEAAGGQQQLNIGLRAMMGEGPAKELAEWLDKVRMKTSLSGRELTMLSASLVKAKVGAALLKPTLAAALDAGAGDPTKGGVLAGAQQAIGAIRTVMSSQNLSEELLNSFSVTKSQALKPLADHMGKSVEQVAKMVSAKKISGENILTSVVTAAAAHSRSGKVGSIAVEFGESLLGTFDRMKNIPGDTLEKLADGKAIGRFTGFLDKVIAKFDTATPAGRAFVAGLEKGLLRVVAALEKIDLEKTVTAALDFFEKLPSRIDKTTTALERMANVGGKLLGFFGDDRKPAISAPTSFGTGLGLISPAVKKDVTVPNAFVGTTKKLDLDKRQLGVLSKIQNFFGIGPLANRGDESAPGPLSAIGAPTKARSGGIGVGSINIPITVNGGDGVSARDVANETANSAGAKVVAALESMAARVGTA